MCLPHPFGDEDRSACRIVAMNCVPIAWRDVDYEYVKSRVSNVMDPDYYYRLRDHIYADFNNMHVNDLGCMEFAGGYPSNLHEEINNYSIIAGVVARTEEFDIIHAHDWLTYPAGIRPLGQGQHRQVCQSVLGGDRRLLREYTCHPV